MNKKFVVNGKILRAESNRRAIIALYPCLNYAVEQELISLTKAVKIANRTFGVHISRSLNAYKVAESCYVNSIINYKYYL